jgi:2-C-methyl-D-erythritol 2,4-cyclodiphosphate synthase
VRVGFGYDIHRLVPGRKLILGGVVIPAAAGEDGHSDGDTLIHAVIDALLGALCLGDIGTFFPSTDPLYKDIESSVLLKKTLRLIKEKQAAIINLDCTVILENPKLHPHRKKIQESLAALLEVEPGQVSIKAKTKEGMDASGRGEAVEAQAAVLMDS